MAQSDAQLFLLSARDETELSGEIAGLAETCRNLNESGWGTLASTLRRRPFEAHRYAVVASTAEELAGYCEECIATGESGAAHVGQVEGDGIGRVAFLYTGQGAQYLGMGRGLYNTEPVFRSAIDACAEILDPLLDRSLLSLLYPEDEQDHAIDETGYTQPTMFAMEYALGTLWRAWGIEPDVVMGHSVGEYAAACMAGVFSLEQGLSLIAERGRLMHRLPRNGGMAAFRGAASDVLPAIEPYASTISVAALNGPRNVVVSGEKEALSRVVEDLASKGIRGKSLTVSHAFHSPLMAPILDEFREAATRVAYRPPQRTFITNLTGEVASTDTESPDYWAEHIRAPVRFATGMETLERQRCDLVVEVGPQPTLLAMGAKCIEKRGVWIPSLRKGKDDRRIILDSAAQAFVAGANLKES